MKDLTTIVSVAVWPAFTVGLAPTPTEKPPIQTTFTEQSGYPLAPTAPCEQYRDIAQFFTAYNQVKNLEL